MSRSKVTGAWPSGVVFVLSIGTVVGASLLSAQDGIVLVPSDTAVGDQFGHVVAISGTTAVIGANGDDGDTGSAYIFERQPGGSWVEVKKLQAPSPQAGDEFGSSVTIFGDDVVVGADLADAAGVDSGAAYVFSRNQGGANQWGFVKMLLGSTIGAGDRFGGAALQDGEVAITSLQGTFLFERDLGGPSNWGEVSATIPPGSMAFNMDTMALGRPVDDDNCPPGNPDCNSGAVIILGRDVGGPGNWGQVTRITAPGTPEGAWFGWSVVISGDTLSVGGIFAPGSGTNSGSAWIFERNLGGPDNWGFSREVIGSTITDNDRYGVSAGIIGDQLVIGSSWGECPGVPDSGAAYLFFRDLGGADQWGESRLMCSNSPADNDIFGSAVAVDVGFAVVGAPHDDVACPGNPNCNSGTAFIFGLPVALDVDVVGNGLVESSPPGISCPSDCTEGYAYETSVALTPTPDPGWAFTIWSGDCTGAGACTVEMTAQRGVTATFLQLHLLTVSVSAGGSVTSSPAGIDCPGDCSEEYVDGTDVTLTAEPDAGFHFVEWTGDCSGAGTCNVTLNAARTVGATFDSMPFIDGFESGDTGQWSSTNP